MLGPLQPLANEIGQMLVERGETVAVAESSAGGLISAALVAVPGASAYFLGGTVVYTRVSRVGLLDLAEAALEGMRPSTEPYARLFASTIRERLASTWAVAETGATGPTGNRYGDPPGHAWVAVAGPNPLARKIETGSVDRQQNMEVFASSALVLLREAIRQGREG
jgi:PncC family amidohydrolase